MTQEVCSTLANADLSQEDWATLALIINARVADDARDQVMQYFELVDAQRVVSWPLVDLDYYRSSLSASGQDASGIESDGQALLHWLRFGQDHGYSVTGLFSAAAYLHFNRDVARSRNYSKRPFLHYLRYGRAQSRKISTVLERQTVEALERYALGKPKPLHVPQRFPGDGNVIDGDGDGAMDPLETAVHEDLTSLLCVHNERAPGASGEDVRELLAGISIRADVTRSVISRTQVRVLALLFDADLYFDLEPAGELLISRSFGVGHFLRQGFTHRPLGPLLGPVQDSDRLEAPAVLDLIRHDSTIDLATLERFSVSRYLAANPGLEELSDPFKHFLYYGQFEGRPVGNGFDPTFYNRRYALDAHSISPYQDFLKHLSWGLPRIPHDRETSFSVMEGNRVVLDQPRDRMWERATGLGPAMSSLTSAWFQSELDRIAPLEPNILSGAMQIPLSTGRAGSRYSEAGSFLRKTAERVRPDVLILLPHIAMGGADKTGAFVARAVLAAGQVPLLVVTDRDVVEDSPWFEGLEVLNLASIASVDHARLLVDFVRGSTATKVVNVNSGLGWKLLSESGQRLDQLAEWYCFLFCWEYDDFNRARYGYASEHFREAFPYLRQVMVDNRPFADDLARYIGTNEARYRIHALQVPPDHLDVTYPTTSRTRRVRGSLERPRIYWAGRNHPQKRFERLVELARTSPEFDFDCWVELDPEVVKDLPDNVYPHDPFASLDDVDWDRADAFLMTSLYEGLPNILTELSSRNVPLIVTEVGGIGDLLDDTTGWILPVDGSSTDWRAVLRSAVDNPDEVEARSRRLIDRVASKHRIDLFNDRVIQILFATSDSGDTCED